MTNEEHIRNIPIEKLADITIKVVYCDDMDENFWGVSNYYITGDGKMFQIRSDAVKHQLEWLKEEKL